MNMFNDTFGEGGKQRNPYNMAAKVELGAPRLVNVNREIGIKQQFFTFIKENRCKGIVKETSVENQIYNDYFVETQFENRNTPVPPFSLIKNKTLYIHEYPLSSGQVIGLRKILQEYSEYFSEQLRNIDLCNCSLSDESFA